MEDGKFEAFFGVAIRKEPRVLRLEMRLHNSPVPKANKLICESHIGVELKGDVKFDVKLVIECRMKSCAAVGSH